jgi:hypothetical protein
MASASAATFVGSEMQHATDKTAPGDFNDASFDYYGVSPASSSSVKAAIPVCP